MDKIDELCKKVDKLTKEVSENRKLLTKVAKSLQLIPVTEEELAEFTRIRLKNEEKVAEAAKLIEENTKPDNRVSLFGESNFTDTEDIYSDVLENTISVDFFDAIEAENFEIPSWFGAELTPSLMAKKKVKIKKQ